MDHTRSSAFLACPERYDLTYNQGLKKVEDTGDDAPLRYGSALHVGLDAYYLPSGMTPAQAFLKAFPAQLSPDDQVRTPATGITVLTEYVNRWGELDKQWKVLAVEKLITCDIGAEEPWEVKYDLIVEGETGIYGIEHKHTARREGFNDTYWRSFEPNSQVTGQVAGLLATYGQCSGIFVNGISIGFNKKAGSRRPAGFWVEFERQLFNRSQRQVDDWKIRTGRTIKRMRATVEWEKNEASCLYCPFNALCVSAGDEQVKATLYEVNPNPLAYLHGEEKVG